MGGTVQGGAELNSANGGRVKLEEGVSSFSVWAESGKRLYLDACVSTWAVSRLLTGAIRFFFPLRQTKTSQAGLVGSLSAS